MRPRRTVIDFENLRNNIVGYQGVTVMLVKTMAGDIFGAVAADTWKDGGYVCDEAAGVSCFPLPLRCVSIAAIPLLIVCTNTFTHVDMTGANTVWASAVAMAATPRTKQVASTESSFLEAWTTAMLYRPVPRMRQGAL